MRIIKGPVIMLLSVVLTLCMISQGVSAQAAHWIVEANNDGLRAYSADDTDKLFDLDRMTPGDGPVSQITAVNRYSYPISLAVEVVEEPVTDSEPRLADQLELRAYIISGSSRVELENFPEVDGGRYLLSARLAPGESMELEFEVYLPGPETGNEYQQTHTNLVWKFYAEATIPDEPSPSPTTPTRRTTTTSTTPTRTAAVDSSQEATVIVEAQTPLAQVTTPETDISEEDVPLGIYEMPKTGEPPLWRSLLLGFPMVLFGTVSLRSGKKARQNKKRNHLVKMKET